MPTAAPVIGVTVDHTRDQTKYELSYDCVQVVVAAGGVPMLLPFAEGVDVSPMLDRIDGLLMSGGNDPDPSAWGEAWHPSCVPADPTREAFERNLLVEAENRKMPVLGMCFGMQLMALVRGGSLHQYLPDIAGKDEHRRLADDDWNRRHPVRANGLLANLAGAELQVNTNHRQAIRQAGERMTVCGTSPDGVIEAIIDESLPFWLGVQWHPERMPGEPAGWPIIAALVNAAGRP